MSSNKAYQSTQQFDKCTEVFDKNLLLEILTLTEEDFSCPMTALELIEALKNEGFLDASY